MYDSHYLHMTGYTVMSSEPYTSVSAHVQNHKEIVWTSHRSDDAENDAIKMHYWWKRPKEGILSYTYEDCPAMNDGAPKYEQHFVEVNGVQCIVKNNGDPMCPESF
jgi:hypothetical protein